MKKSWIHPEEIYLADHLNPRQLNQGFIESLVESMQTQGFLPQYPVKVFESETLTCIETELPYTCVSGMHRTTSAQLAKLDQILCEVHTGEDDAFIEMMMMDNFEYDPAQNAELGQIFSQREKRNACKRLLFIPKFLKMTNSALAETWHTAEVNIRRWRKEVASSIDEGITVVLRDKGVPLDRLPELREILASRQREDADGNIVAIRTAPREMTDDEKSDFWEQIREDAGYHNDGWLEQHGIMDFDYVRRYLAEKYGVENTYQIYEDLTTQQLRQSHGWMLADDPELIAGCKSIAEVDQQARALRGELNKACESIDKWLLGEFVQGNKWSQPYKDCRKAFTEAARQNGHADYCEESYNFPTVKGKPETFKSAVLIVDAVQRDIIGEVDWILEFRQKMEKDITAKRQQLEKDWVHAKQALSDAFEAYPRNISIGAFCYALEDEYYEKSGTYLKLLSLKEPSNRVHNDTLSSQVKNFKRAAKGLIADEKWVQAIGEELRKVDEKPEQKPEQTLAEVFAKNGFPYGVVGSIHIEWGIKDKDYCAMFGGGNSHLNPNVRPLSDVDASLLCQLLELAVTGSFHVYTTEPQIFSKATTSRDEDSETA